MPEDTARGSATPGKVLVGVSGGIAAYKTCELVRLLRKAGRRVRVVMTRSAAEFVTPLTFATLSGDPVALEPFGPDAHRMPHIELARWADLLVVAPATAGLLARFAAGTCDDLLSTLYVAYEGQTLLAPAMNTAMWQHPAVVENRRRLEVAGVRLIGPREGETACGETGVGPMLEPEEILREVDACLARGRDLSGRQVLITAGATREHLDPVRFLSNPSSGRMGLELAREAASRGARVRLIHGPMTGGTGGPGISTEPVTSSEEMYEAVMAHIDSADVFIGAAAVGDFRPETRSGAKIKKAGRERLTLELVRCPDILEGVGRRRRSGQVVVGFALETGGLLENAREKLRAKGADMIVANELQADGAPFGASESRVLLLEDGAGALELPLMSKRLVARAVLDRVRSRLNG